MSLLLALLLAVPPAFAEPVPAAPPPLSRTNWERAVQHARGLHDAVKAQIAQIDFSADLPKELTPGAGRSRRPPKEGRLRRPTLPAVPAPQAAVAPVPQAYGVQALPSLEQAVAPLGPDAVAPRDPRCADPRARADRGLCPGPSGI